MKNISLIFILVSLFIFNCKDRIVDASEYLNPDNPKSQNSIFQFTMKDIKGNDVPLSNYKGKVILIVNTASKCGLTPQYEDLQKLYESYKDSNFVILGFPANNFLHQEPGTNQEISEFCSVNYGVTFPMFSKISVKGNDMHPLYKYLTEKEENGVLDAPVSWNFQKFLINKEGQLVASFNPKTTVKDEDFLSIFKEQFSTQ